MINSTAPAHHPAEAGASRRDQGFTLVEILIAIVLVGILSVVVVIGIGNLTESGSSAACKASQDAAVTASRAYLASAGAYPKKLTDLTPADNPALELPAKSLMSTSGMAVSVGDWKLTMTAVSGAAPTFACGKATDAEISAPVPALCPGDPNTTWVGEYYNNVNLTGTPIDCRNDAAIDFNWAGNGPGSPVTAHTFSVRWTRKIAFTEGQHTFTVGSDDGTRLYIDGVIVRDDWKLHPYQVESVNWPLAAGNHTVVLEFYENLGNARATLTWS